MKALRIAIVGWANSVHVQRWARGLAGRGYEIKVISLGGKPIDGISTTITPRQGRLSYLTQAGKAIKAIKEFKPDLVHAHYATGNGWWGIKSGLHPLVLSVWGADVMDFPSNMIKRAMVRKILKSADHITATSQLLKRVTVELLPEAEKKTTVIPFGVEPMELAPKPPTGAVCRFCFVKVHYRKYGPDILLQAVDIARRTVPDIKLSMAGEGPLTPHLKQMRIDLHLEDHVEFVGFIDNRKILPFIAEHHFMVMPSVMASESFGVAVLEAAACSRPVIASDIGGVPEVVRSGETGLLIEPGDVDQLVAAIIKLAQDRQLADQLGQAAYKFLKENYTWTAALDAMENLYHQLVTQQKDANEGGQ